MVMVMYIALYGYCRLNKLNDKLVIHEHAVGNLDQEEIDNIWQDIQIKARNMVPDEYNTYNDCTYRHAYAEYRFEDKF